jgi:hypothetical protein
VNGLGVKQIIAYQQEITVVRLPELDVLSLMGKYMV